MNADVGEERLKASARGVQAAEAPDAEARKPDDGSTRPPGDASTSVHERPAPPDASLVRPVRTASVAPTRVIVAFRTGVVRAASAGRVHARAGASVVDAIPQLHADVVKFGDPAAAQASLATYRSDPNVAYAELDEVDYALEVPNDPRYAEQWGYAKVMAPEAWSLTHGSASVVVAVLDTGIFFGHPDLQGKVVASRNFTYSPDASDRHGHGTHVAGTIAATTGNGVGVAGMGHSTTLIVGKVLGDDNWGYTSWIANGITWAADNGAKVVNLSLGSTNSCSSPYQDAIDYAWARGVVVVASAGNEAKPGAGRPANCNHVVSVAASTTSDGLASFSNFGPAVTVAAPGVSILSTTNDGGYGIKQGTSMAAPHVAGLAALIWATQWGTGAQDVVDRLTQTTDAIPGTGSTTTHGRINAHRAVGGNPPAYVAPAFTNDSVNSPTLIAALPFVAWQTTVGATTYTGEPNCSIGWYGATVWFQFTATASGSVAVDTTGSSFDTVVAIYDSPLSTPALACNDEAYDALGPSRATVSVSAGATYLVQVGGKSGASGSLAIRVGHNYSNNDLSGAFTALPPFLHDFDTTVATRSVGEAQPCASIGATSWYRYDATSVQSLLISTASSSFDTAVAVYAAYGGPTSTYADLTTLGCVDDSGSSLQARANLFPDSGTTYYIQVGGYSGAYGRLQFSLSLIDAASNDQLASAWPVTVDPASWTVSTVGSRTESGEPQPCGQIGSTVWYRWVPTRAGLAQVTTSGSDFDTVLAIYSGPTSLASFSSLALLECNDGVAGASDLLSRVSGNVLAGMPYYVQVGGYRGDFGSTTVNFSVTDIPTATRVLAISPGWNLVTLGIAPATPLSASSICTGANGTVAGSVVEVVRYDAGGWVSHRCSVPASDFTLAAGAGYFVKATVPTNFTYSGSEFGQPPTVTLASGWTLIGLPRTTGSVAGVAAAINGTAGVAGATLELHRWANGLWDGLIAGVPANAFSIEGDRGYAVRTNRAVTWQPGAAVSSLAAQKPTATGTAAATPTPTSTSTSTSTSTPDAAASPSPTPTATPAASATHRGLTSPIPMPSIVPESQPPVTPVASSTPSIGAAAVLATPSPTRTPPG